MDQQTLINRFDELHNDAFTYRDYARVGSISRAHKYREALEGLIIFRPQRSERGGANASEVTVFTPEVLERELHRVNRWIAAKTYSERHPFSYANIDVNRR